jgi:hypothetical protein
MGFIIITLYEKQDLESQLPQLILLFSSDFIVRLNDDYSFKMFGIQLFLQFRFRTHFLMHQRFCEFSGSTNSHGHTTAAKSKRTKLTTYNRSSVRWIIMVCEFCSFCSDGIHFHFYSIDHSHKSKLPVNSLFL